MMKAGVPLLQSFDIVGKGAPNPAIGKLVYEIKTEVETGSSLAQAFRKYPLYFDQLFCNLVQAGEQAGILETLLDRLATYQEKILAIQSKIKAALFYPIAIIVVAFIITAVIMIFVIPAFKEVFSNFGADLPGPTLFVMAISDFFVKFWYLIFTLAIGGVIGFLQAWKRSLAVQIFMDRLILRMPPFGSLVRKSVIARWTRTLSTMRCRGRRSSRRSIPSVAHRQLRVRDGDRRSSGSLDRTSLTVAMQNVNVFPSMVIQMVSTARAGALDGMLSKVADFYEAEVDDAVEALSSLMEPIMVVLAR
jgi:type IV pilus assembly protein PilC